MVVSPTAERAVTVRLVEIVGLLHNTSIHGDAPALTELRPPGRAGRHTQRS
jgi:hypothetical protein